MTAKKTAATAKADAAGTARAKLDDLFNQMAGELLIKGRCAVLTDLHDSKESFAEALAKANRKVGC